jgi:drug/metabolite transporter (DMT)-like permease
VRGLSAASETTEPASPPTSPGAATPPKPPLSLVLGAFAALYIVWGSTYLGIRLAIESIPAFFMAGSRFVTAGAILYAIMRARGAGRPTRRQWVSATIIGALLLLVGNGGVTWAEHTVPSGVTALVIAAVPAWIALADWLRPGGRRPGALAIAGIGIGFAGVALLVSGRSATGAPLVNPVGAAVLILATICWAAGSIYSRHAPKPAQTLLAIAMQMLAGGALQLLVGLALGEARQLSFAAITPTSAWAWVYLTAVGSLVGFTAYVWLLQVSTPAKVSTYAYVNPLIAVLLGHVVLNETIPPGVALAGSLILGAVILLTVRSHR